MSERLEIILGSVVMGLFVVAAEFLAVYVYTGSMPWNL